jgi:asparagine synthase (glutamine-hydrolysing)
MCNEDGSIQIVFNGEIYNYRDLRRRLEGAGHTFRTNTDTETIVHLYEDLGIECFEHLNGMFAIAIWDDRQQQLVLARDRMGKKPLFYAHRPGQLVFGSELKTLACIDDLPRRVDPGAIDLYLTYQYVPHPHTIYKDIFKLEPGYVATYRDDQLERQSFWKIDWSKQINVSRDEAIDRVRHLLEDSVRIRLQSDVPLGAFLSGGIDSSLIVAIAQKQMQEPIKTFSIGFPVKDYDETHYAQMVADHVGTEHRRFEVSPDAIRVLDKLVYHYDEPFSDSSAIPTWYLCEHTRQQVTVALSGDGGDELFAGYERYQALWLSQMMRQYLPIEPLLNNGLVRRLPTSDRQRSFFRRLKRFGEALGQPIVRRYLNWLQIFGEESRIGLYREDFIEQLPNRDPVSFLESAWAKSGKRDVIAKASTSDLQTYMPCDLMTKVDIASMAHSLEARQPLLDYRLVEYAASLPTELKFRRGHGKLLLRDAFGHLLPPAIWNRKKMGFGVPISEWFKGPLRSITESSLLAPDSRCHAFFRPEAVAQLVQDHISGRNNQCYRLWNLFILEHWLRRWM